MTKTSKCAFKDFILEYEFIEEKLDTWKLVNNVFPLVSKLVFCLDSCDHHCLDYPWGTTYVHIAIYWITLDLSNKGCINTGVEIMIQYC